MTKDSYLPSSNRAGMALCLSGGGFRASLFHMGALRRLHELGILSRLETISGVSGGSIVAAHLAAKPDKWSNSGADLTGWQSEIADCFHSFVRKNHGPKAFLKQFLPWNWFNSSAAVESLIADLFQNLTSAHLTELPTRPNFIFCATDMAFGVNWIMSRERIGDYQVGFTGPPSNWTVARAVGASSCFPPFFNPLPIKLDPDLLIGGKARNLDNRQLIIKGLRLTDGGNYDEFGLEPVWKDHAVVLVSDGGSAFNFGPDQGLFWRLSRYVSILGNQSTTIRKRWLISNFKARILQGTYWGIGSSVSSYGFEQAAGYSEALVKTVICQIRTALDSFSEAEIAVLENHGYTMAEVAVKKHLPAVISQQHHPFAIPYPEWMDEAKVKKALAGSQRLGFLGRWK